MRTDENRRVGILAFGSLIHDPGPEIGCLVVKRIKVRTPFAVEFARYSRGTRAGAPTLSPVIRGGAPVDAMILVLKHGTSLEQAMDMLWRRETGNIGTRKKYPAAHTSRAVRVRRLRSFAGVAEVSLPISTSVEKLDDQIRRCWRVGPLRALRARNEAAMAYPI